MDENRVLTRDKLPIGPVISFNQQSKAQKIMEINDKGADWTDTDAHPPFLWGQAAAQISDVDEAGYDVFQPIHKGRLNVTPTRPFMTVTAHIGFPAESHASPGPGGHCAALVRGPVG